MNMKEINEYDLSYFNNLDWDFDTTYPVNAYQSVWPFNMDHLYSSIIAAQFEPQ